MRYSIPFIISSISLAVASPIFERSIPELAPLISKASSQHEIPDSYIVVFKDHVTDVKAFEHQSWVQELHQSSTLKKRSQFPLLKGVNGLVESAIDGVKHTYNIAGKLLGYSGSFDESVLSEIRKHPDVAFVEKDSTVYTQSSDPATQNSSPWGLARISHREPLDFGTFNKYVHQPLGGEGVTVYVVDTGTNYQHVDFEGRAKWGKTIPQGDVDADGNGHGTHCSGTIAGKKYGVAKKANVVAVKVLRSNGSGTMSDVVKGVEWAAIEHTKAAAKKDPKFKGSVANMSLGGGKSPTLDLTVNAAVDVGVNFAVAAGNDNSDACDYSPAAAANAVTVAASTLADERAYFSNYGKCVDIFGPGLNIQSTWIGSKYATKTISGTSMASPHIAGLLAYFISLQPKEGSEYAVGSLTPKQWKEKLIAISTKDVLSNVPSDTVNYLAWNGGGKSNLSEIFKDTHKVSHKNTPKIEELVENVSKEVLEDTEKFFHDIQEMIEDEIKGVFENARSALKHAHQ